MVTMKVRERTRMKEQESKQGDNRKRKKVSKRERQKANKEEKKQERKRTREEEKLYHSFKEISWLRKEVTVNIHIAFHALCFECPLEDLLRKQF